MSSVVHRCLFPFKIFQFLLNLYQISAAADSIVLVTFRADSSSSRNYIMFPNTSSKIFLIEAMLTKSIK